MSNEVYMELRKGLQTTEKKVQNQRRKWEKWVKPTYCGQGHVRLIRERRTTTAKRSWERRSTRGKREEMIKAGQHKKNTTTIQKIYMEEVDKSMWTS